MTINYEIQEQELEKELDDDLEIDEDIQKFLSEFEEMEMTDMMNDDELCVAMLDYETNYNVNQLQLICEYYSIKTARLKKNELIVQILLFENWQNILLSPKTKMHLIITLKNILSLLITDFYNTCE